MGDLAMTTDPFLDAGDFEQACHQEEWARAIDICQERLALGQDTRYWKLQLGLVNFLWEGNIDAHDIAAARILKELAEEFPSDPEVLFWTAYVIYITTEPNEFVLNLLARALDLDPSHAYANLLTAGYLQFSNKAAEAYTFLRRALETQPGNRRILRQIMVLASQLGRSDDVISAANSVLNTEPYVERSMSCMNEYANDVLAGYNDTVDITRLARRAIETGGKVVLN